MLATLLVISLAVFAAFEIIPGDPALSRLGKTATPEALFALREQMGLNSPFIVRYFKWITGCLHLDFGMSYSYMMPVSELVLSKLPITLMLTLLSILITIVVSVPVGIFLAKHADGIPDRIGYSTNQFIMALPSFFLGIIITYAFGFVLNMFKPGNYISYDSDFLGFLGYMVFPALSIAIPKCAMSVNFLRSAIITEAGKNYVRTAYSRGNSTMDVMYHHVLRNTMMPMVTFWGMVVIDMIAGTIVVEQVFSIPGLGRMLIGSISNRDYPVVEAIIFLIAVIVLLCNFLTDFIYRLLDPRQKS